MQTKLEDYTYNFNPNISVSILDEFGDFIVDINGQIPRIPASNQKILSSAFSLDTLGPYYTLKTSLKEINDGSLYIEASGDPDFDKSHLEELINDLNSTNYNSTSKLVCKGSHILNFSGLILLILSLCLMYENNEIKLPLTIFTDKKIKQIYKYNFLIIKLQVQHYSFIVRTFIK